MGVGYIYLEGGGGGIFAIYLREGGSDINNPWSWEVMYFFRHMGGGGAVRIQFS